MIDLIYLDNNATTQPLPEVVEAMVEVLRDDYANPSSTHRFGQSVRHRIECAREQVANLIGAAPREIVFTSGGTESINLGVRGLLSQRGDKRRIVTTAVEHHAVHRVCDYLVANGYTVEYVGVDREGRVDESHWEESLTDDTALVSLIHANNETGVITDVPKLAAMAADRGIPVHVDAVQSAGKLPVDVSAWPTQLVSLSAHKFHGPNGAGALYVRRRTPVGGKPIRLEPLIFGGSQERDRRGGTEHIAGIVGMGVAAVAAERDGAEVTTRVGALRDKLETGVLASVPFAQVNAANAPRVYNTTNISFKRLGAEAILILLSEAGICASSGAACGSGAHEPSHVLKAMNVEEAYAHGAIRFSVSRFTTEEQIDRVVALLPNLLSKLTALSG